MHVLQLTFFSTEQTEIYFTKFLYTYKHASAHIHKKQKPYAANIHTHTNMDTHTNKHTHKRINRHTQTHKRINRHTHIHTQTNKQTHILTNE